MEKITSLQVAEKAMVEVSKELSLIDKTYGKVGPSCYAVHEYLKSDMGKGALEAAETSMTAWVKAHLKSSTPEAFFNASRRYAESLLTPKQKQAKADKAKADKAQKKEDQKRKENAIPADFSTFEAGLRLYVKGLTDEQVLTCLAIIEQERLSRTDKVKTNQVKMDKTAVPTGKRRTTAASGTVVQVARKTA